MITEQEYLDLLSQTVTQVERGYGRKEQTLEDSSFDTWVKYYRQDENSPNALVSYYTKGAVFALCLDLTIRRETRGAKSLDDVMRALWSEYGCDFVSHGRGIAEHEWEVLAQRVSGVDLSELFALGLRTTQDLPLAEILAEVGILLQQRIAEGATDKGGWLAAPQLNKTSLACRISADAAGVKLTHVLSAGAAEVAGLAAGDCVIAINGLRVTAANWESALSAYQLGETIRVHAFRRDELLELSVTLQAASCDTVGLKRCDEASADALKAQRQWLSGKSE